MSACVNMERERAKACCFVAVVVKSSNLRRMCLRASVCVRMCVCT